MTELTAAPIESLHNKRRILFISLEFNYSPFSGNGVLARSLISGLVQRNAKGCDVEVRVICAMPHESTRDLSSDVPMDSSEHLEVWPVHLPEGCQWKRLDRYGPWKEFADGCTGTYGGVDYSQQIQEFAPVQVVAVDWHGMLVWEQICDRMKFKGNGVSANRTWSPSQATVCYYNFRVYSASSWEHANSSHDVISEESDEQFYKSKEQHSCRLADTIICLSDHDRDNLQYLMNQDGILDVECSQKLKNVEILPPPLRGDILDLATRDFDEMARHLPPQAHDAIGQLSNRAFITCMVRLSPEKSPHHFVSFLQKMGGVDFLKRAKLIPLICGARSDESYARTVLDELNKMCCDEWPCVVIDHFLGPREMAAVFSLTAINVHPCLYDAYGMTVVEAAAFGATSIVNKGGKIGATSLLKEGVGCVAVDLHSIIIGDVSTLSDCMHQIRTHDTSLNGIREKGRSLALGWNEEAYCIRLLDVILSKE